MNTRVLNILVCGANQATLNRMVRQLSGEGVMVQTSYRLLDCLSLSSQAWDFLIIDLDSINSFLRTLLPPFFRKYPKLVKVGVSFKSATTDEAAELKQNLELDACACDLPKPEELIVFFPQVAACYLCDEQDFDEPGVQLPAVVEDYEKEVGATAHNVSFTYREFPLAL